MYLTFGHLLVKQNFAVQVQPLPEIRLKNVKIVYAVVKEVYDQRQKVQANVPIKFQKLFGVAMVTFEQHYFHVDYFC